MLWGFIGENDHQVIVTGWVSIPACRRTISFNPGSPAEGGLKFSIWLFDMPTNSSLPQAMARRSAFCSHPTFTGMNKTGFRFGDGFPVSLFLPETLERLAQFSAARAALPLAMAPVWSLCRMAITIVRTCGMARFSDSGMVLGPAGPAFRLSDLYAL
jgi:hypothetical protein